MQHQSVSVESVDDVSGRMVAEVATAAGVALTLIGLRAGLWRALADGSWFTSAEIAGATRYPEPFVREWLRAQAAGGLVGYDPATDRFRVPAAVAEVTTGPQSAFLAALSTQVMTWYVDLDDLIVGLLSGKGFGWGERDPRNAEAMDAISRNVVAPALAGAWLPALDGVAVRLAGGGRIADVGCGYGTPTRAVASAFPSAEVFGFDPDESSIARARRVAATEGLGDRIRFEVASAKTYPEADYDLITFVDVLHDLGDPLGALRHAEAALATDGAVVLVEPASADRVEDNFTPIGQLFYAASALVCTPNALAQEGAAIGTLAGEVTLRKLAAEAGFHRVRRLPADAPFNLLLELRR